MKMYCRDCKDLKEANYQYDKDCGFGWYECTLCGGDDMTEEFHRCALCGQYKPDDDLIWWENAYYCQDCIDKYAHRAIKKIESWPREERAALNIKYEGLPI